jgi:hypothetical protein
MLSEDILLNIFRHYLVATPRIWSLLTCVCPRWRQIVLTSPLGLNLRLYCTYGRPFLKSLACWPALPIIVQYGGVPNLDPPAPQDDDNIIAALQQSGRVSSVSLTITSSLHEKLSAISEPLLELEDLVLLSQDNMQLTLPSTFRWGTRLRTLSSTRIAFPSFPQKILSCQDLVDLQLHEIPSAGYFSPEAFANCLSEMTQLRSLTLHLLSCPRRGSYLDGPPPTWGHITLPALTHLKYRGTSKYLDSLVARIDAPLLEDIYITFFNQPTMDASQLGRFIERTETLVPLSHVDVQTSAHAISISFTSSSTSARLELHISCKQLYWQLSSLAQVCDQFFPFLPRVQNLAINTTKSPSGQNDVDGERWLEILRSLGGARDLSVAGEVATHVLCALRPANGDGGHTTDTILLPSLRNLRVQPPEQIDGPFRDAALSIITSRRLSGRPMTWNFIMPRLQYPFFARSQDSISHLAHKHAYRMMCSHCNDFECILRETIIYSGPTSK